MLNYKKLTGAFVAGLMLCSAQMGSARAGESFILAHPMPTEHVFHALVGRFQAELEGKGFEIRYHPAGDLGDWTSLFEQSMQGVIPMSITWGASEFDQRLDLSWLAYVVDNWEDARRVYGPGGDMLGIYSGS